MARSTHHRHYQVLLRLLRELREQAGVTQAAMGERLGNTQTFVSKLERGERRVDLVEFVEICEILNVDPVGSFALFVERRGAEKGTPVRKKASKTTGSG